MIWIREKVNRKEAVCVRFFILFLVAMVISAIGFKKFVWFISLGYGFAIAGIRSEAVKWSVVKWMVCTLPAGGFFAVTVLGMICMGIFAGKLDSTKVRSNWIEQTTNAIAQGWFLLGVVSCILK